MQKKIHPKLYKVKVIMTNGDEHYIYSAKNIEKISLDVDINTHPAWVKNSLYKSKIESRFSKFNERYSDF